MVKPHLKFLILTPTRWLTKSLEIIAVAFCLVIGMYDPIVGQEYDIQSYIQPESLTVGDKFIFVNKIKIDPTLGARPADLTEKLGDADVISGIYKLPDTGDGYISYACTLAVYKTGEIDIPSFVFEIQDTTGEGETFIGKGVKTVIMSVLPADTADVQIADIKEPRKLSGPIWPYFVIPLAIAGLIYLGLTLKKRFAKDIELPSVSPRPPWEIAVENLDLLKGKRHPDFGRFHQFYFELSLVIREYIECRYDIPAVESTTYELENENELASIDNNLYRNLFDLFSRADMTKFAKFVPAVIDTQSDISFAYDFVSSTIPKILTPESDSATDKKTESENVQI